MPVNKVVYGNNTLIDITDTTATPSDVALGKTFYQADGSKVAGTDEKDTDPRDVIFIDYDGTVLYAYTPKEVAKLTELPPNPSHQGLIAQGWNWNLEDLKTYVNKYGGQVVGQMYTTYDGKTRFYITIQEGSPETRRTIDVILGAANSDDGADIALDWGDGTEPVSETIGTSVTFTHTYSNAGNYVIAINAIRGEIVIPNGSASINVLGSISQSHRKTILQKVEIGDNVSSIGSYSFTYCQDLATISLSKDVKNVGGCCFQYDSQLLALVIPYAVTNLGAYLLHNCAVIKAVSIPNTIDTIERYMFCECVCIDNIYIPDSVTNIKGERLFSRAITAAKIVIPTISELRITTTEYIFNECYNLRDLHILDTGINNIGRYGYTNTKIEEAIIPDGIVSIGDYAFRNCRLLKRVVLPESLTTIGSYAFSSCTSLENVNIPGLVTTIPINCFSGSTCLKKVEIPEGVTRICDNAFYGCTALVNITIPSTVNLINTGAFGMCTSLGEIHVRNTTPPTLSTNVFSSLPTDCKIYVPYSEDHSILNNYQTTVMWSTFATYMVEEPQE